jgi:hypothetical protein
MAPLRCDSHAGDRTLRRRADETLEMTKQAALDPPEISDGDLETALSAVLTSHFGRPRTIVDLRRELAPYRSSCHLEDVGLTLDGGATLEVVFKDLGRSVENAAQVKPEFLSDPQREIETYRSVLSHARLGTPLFYGATVNPAANRYWLFLEKVPGTRLKELGEFRTWELAARWVAVMHAEYAPQVNALKQKTHLLNYDRGYLDRWISRARHVSGGTPATAKQIDTLAQCYDALVERLAALPVTLIHGEFYPSNILVRDTPSGPSVSPVDWEMAAVGPALLDLAAFTSGGWSDKKVIALARAYYDVAGPAFKLSSFDEFMTALDGCRLFLAVQWLGWSTDWQPPPEHDHDWLTAALQLAKRLGFVATRRPRSARASAAAGTSSPGGDATAEAPTADATAPGSSQSAAPPAPAPTRRGARSRR